MNKILLLFLPIFVFCCTVSASHVPGGNITYQCVGPNTYVVTLTLFEDCGTAFETNGPEPISISNDCGYSFGPSISLPNISFQQEVSQLCFPSLPQSECSGGTLPGVYMHIWQDTITLPGPCDSWTFSYSSCCRNQSNNLIGTGNNYYWESVLNSTTSSCNSSPIITSQPIPYVCVNQPVVYNFGVYEQDGNSLVYSLVNASTGAGMSAPYNAGYSGPSPIAGISINPSTGEIQFTPTVTGNFVVAVLIEEFDSNGNLVGSIIQDFQFEVISSASCLNNNPTATGITNFISTGVQTGPNDIQLCQGDNVCFDVEFTDINALDSIYLVSNVGTLFPGATFTQNSYSSPATATICFIVGPTSNPFSTISVDAQDNACPVVGISSMVVGVTVISSTYAGQDVVMCDGVGVQLNATGGSNFNWTLISGDPISVGSNFSCTNCPNPIANPSISSIYQVISNLSGGCTNVDTVEVAVVPDFSYSLTQTALTTCLNSDVQLIVNPNPTGNYDYQWSPGIFLDNSSISNPLFTPTMPGNYNYEIQITSDDGCLKTDTLSIEVLAAYSPDVTVSLSDSSIYCGDTVSIDIDLGGGVPAFCGPSASTVCTSAESQQTIGVSNSVNGNTSWPAPFGNWYKNAKHQFLFTAAELQASGFIGGKITEIAWETTLSNNATSIFESYSIKMGCTNLTALSTWESGLTTVFGPQDITVSLGWNTLTFSTAYEWDGISNLIVEICYDNLSSPYTYNWATPYTNTAFNSCLYYYSDVANACSATTQAFSSPSTSRPVTRFTSCATTPDSSNFSFSWSPSTALSNDAIINPSAFPIESTVYSVVVTDLVGGCSDTNQVLINVEPPYELSDTSICDNEFQYVGVTASNYGFWDYSGPGNVYFSSIDSLNPFVEVDSFGTYFLSYYDNLCLDTLSHEIAFINDPFVEVSTMNTFCIGTDLEVAIIPNNLVGIDYTWKDDLGNTIGNGDTVLILSSSLDNGVYIYSVEAENICGLYTEDFQIVAESCEIPNVISPNGDGNNDYFYIQVANTYSDVNLTIVNRWGKVIFQSTAYSNDWNGTNKNGKPLSDGTYFYILNYNNAEQEKSGTITIVNNK